jgi:PAS domain S-box-containing protein
VSSTESSTQSEPSDRWYGLERQAVDQHPPLPSAERERQRAEAAEALYAALFQSTADAIVVADESGHYLDANPAAVELLGYSREELLGMRVPDIVAAPTEWTQTQYEQFTRSGSWRDELEVRRKDGTAVPVEAAASRLELPQGTRYISVLREISARRHLEALRERWTAMLAHELRNPITAIAGWGQVLQRRTPDDRAVQRILEQTGVLQRLVEDLVELARSETGNLGIRPAEIDLSSIVQAAVATANAHRTGHAVKLEAPSEPLLVWADAARVQQVLTNLLNNALAYSPEGSPIVVRLEPDAEQVRVAVQDRGRGIPADEQSRVFEPFYRASDAGGGRGLGLGLYICRALIEAHGGSLDLESQPGEGSTFSFTLSRSATSA